MAIIVIITVVQNVPAIAQNHIKMHKITLTSALHLFHATRTDARICIVVQSKMIKKGKVSQKQLVKVTVSANLHAKMAESSLWGGIGPVETDFQETNREIYSTIHRI